MADTEEIPSDVRQVIICTSVLSADYQHLFEMRSLESGISDVHQVWSFDAILDWVDRLPRDYEAAAGFIQVRLGLHAKKKDGKERSMAKDRAPGTKTILVVDADTTQLDEATRCDPRIRHWGARDIHEGASIPDGIDRVISCGASLKRTREAILAGMVKQARDAGRTMQHWNVPHQGRLRVVLAEELRRGVSGDAPQPPPVRLDIHKPENGVPVPLPGAAPDGADHEDAPQPEAFGENGNGGSDSADGIEGKANIMETITVGEIVRQNVAATGDDTNVLLTIVRRYHPQFAEVSDQKIKARIWSALAGLKRGKPAAAPGGVRPDASGRSGATPGFRPADAPSVTLGERYAAAVAKIQEGLDELNVLGAEIKGMDVRLQLLAPLEAAMQQVASRISK